MTRTLAAFALVGLMAAVAVVGFNMPGPLLGSDRNRGERHEKVSLAAIAALPTFTAVAALDVREIEQAIAEAYAAAHGRYVGGLAAQAAVVPPEIHYAPEERLDRIDVSLIENAGTSIDMAAYVLSDWAIIDAPNDAEARGVKVRVILDPREHSDVSRLVGLDVRQKRPGPLQHFKAYEIDGQILRTGSENFSHSAPSQDNDLVVIRDPQLTARFEADFERMWKAAQPTRGAWVEQRRTAMSNEIDWEKTMAETDSTWVAIIDDLIPDIGRYLSPALADAADTEEGSALLTTAEFQLAYHYIGPVLEAHPGWGWRDAVEWMRANGGVPQIAEAEIEAQVELLRGASRQ